MKKIMMVIVMIVMATFVGCGCGEEPRKEVNNTNDGFVTFEENVEIENVEIE